MLAYQINSRNIHRNSKLTLTVINQQKIQQNNFQATKPATMSFRGNWHLFGVKELEQLQNNFKLATHIKDL
ncbi:hypothetical protein BHC44_07220 [Snodgrassella alvi]|jgi:hypothetical protein|uniref:Uncharacterized protein n=1 Tax=Snodgrassella alvi TaxID=1196083 RepID=A0A2N9XUZ1_9NEIS|nr:hypothetical protein [Snodgrassella alvi]PIT52645.1 hypothetical protein BHC44_07220 [Snodgrassella alvi]PIT53317.1 hypothetical protein BHC49_13035 [Snodgrassella alvi]